MREQTRCVSREVIILSQGVGERSGNAGKQVSDRTSRPALKATLLRSVCERGPGSPRVPCGRHADDMSYALAYLGMPWRITVDGITNIYLEYSCIAGPCREELYPYITRKSKEREKKHDSTSKVTRNAHPEATCKRHIRHSRN